MRRQALTALVLVPMLALMASACGGADGTARSQGTGKPAASDGDKMRAYAKCMRENGVDMPDPKEGDGRITVRMSGKPGKGSEDTMKAAEQKCRKLMPNGGKPKKPNPRQLAEARQMSKCMRENGVPDFPDPNPDGGIAIKAEKGAGGLNPESPTFKKAQKACLPKGEKPSTGGDKGGPGLSTGDGE